MKFISISLITLVSLISADNYELIAELKNIANGYFSTNLKNTGLENENDPTANTYSIIGTFNNDEAKKNAYRGDDGKFGLKLNYYYSDGTEDELIWRQTSWIADANIVGADLSQIPSQAGKASSNQFFGLGLSTYTRTYLDGTANQHINWFHSVGSNGAWAGGIPGDREAQAAYSMALYIINPDQCNSVTCPDDLLCEEGECVRDCSVLDIDGFLTDCSTEFADNTADIGQLESRVTAVEGKATANEAAITALAAEDGNINARIDALESRVGTNEGAITGLGSRLTTAEGNIATTQSDISTLQGRVGNTESAISNIDGEIAAINSVLDRLSAQSAGPNFIHENDNVNDVNTDNKLPLIPSETKDLLILFLLGMNMVSLCVMCAIWVRSKDKYSKYDKVRGYETEENIQLHH